MHHSPVIASEAELLSYARELGAANVPELHPLERALLETQLPRVPSSVIEQFKTLILAGSDPLGDAFTRLRSPEVRRPRGATYTPHVIVGEMVRWAGECGKPTRVVDPGVGSARFLRAAAAQFPDAMLVGADTDPVATLMARATLSVAGFGERSNVLLEDYRALRLPSIEGRTLFIGNPPYVRHHLVEAGWKNWLSKTASEHGLVASKLAGLHVHFYLATFQLARKGDFGTFITAAEWLDVNYGSLVRDLFLNRLGGSGLVMVDPTACPFPDAASTAVITTFEIGRKPRKIAIRKIDRLECLRPLDAGAKVPRERLATEKRWTQLLRATRVLPEGYVELGEICRVHRGQVTGANHVWIAEKHQHKLPSSVLFRAITKARDLINVANGVLADATRLRHVIDLPEDLEELESEERSLVERFLGWARNQGAHKSYVARHRRAWWTVGLRVPPPIMVTYMGRRPPVFVRNVARARYINIAHGIYPREPLSQESLDSLTAHLAAAAADAQGRVYAGGLLKFEPREIERIPVPQFLVVHTT